METLDFTLKAMLAVVGLTCGIAVILSHSKAGRDVARRWPKVGIASAMIGAVAIYTVGYYHLLWFIPSDWGLSDGGDSLGVRISLTFLVSAPLGLATINALWSQDEAEKYHQMKIKSLQDQVSTLSVENRQLSDEGYNDWREAVRLRERVIELESRLNG